MDKRVPREEGGADFSVPPSWEDSTRIRGFSPGTKPPDVRRHRASGPGFYDRKPAWGSQYCLPQCSKSHCSM